jgi:phytoene dehydrogenase-like protein
VISNLTIWDTFGKLVSLNRTPVEIRKRLTALKGWGAYLIFLGIDESVTGNLPATRILALSEEQNFFDPEDQIMFAAAPVWDPRAPEGKRAVTVLTFTDVEDWFTFHDSVDELESQDQAKLEELWQRLHQTLPELGDHAEVIETATPLDCYEGTRRKLGMVGWPGVISPLLPNDGSTPFENLYVVGDSVSEGSGIALVTNRALKLANKITNN